MSTKIRALDGQDYELATMSMTELDRVHYDQEVEYARRILLSKPFSTERAQLMNAGYEFVHSILSEIAKRKGKQLELGAHGYAAGLVIKALQYYKTKYNPEKVYFFEGGIGTGRTIKAASKLPYADVSGCDVSLTPTEEFGQDVRLYQGTVLDILNQLPEGSINVFFWDNVIEHIPADEINVTLELIQRKLSKNGLLITITPNWYLRPADVTKKFNPPGTEAKGFHFKEYSFKEITKLLGNASFKRVFGPCFINPVKKRYLVSFGTASQVFHKIKYSMEPLAGVLPYSLRRYFISMFAYRVTIAEK